MRIGTRGSALALAQARHVAGLLGGAEIVTIATSGDRASDGEKSRWVDTIEQALKAGEIDLAVHSAKDVPGELAEGLELLGAPARADARDVLCGAPALDALPDGASVGTSSIRRTAQLRAAREDLRVVAIGGNVDTRLRHLGERHEQDDRDGQGDRTGGGHGPGDRTRGGQGPHNRGGRTGGGHDLDSLHAIVLARAGLQRLGREHELGAVLDLARFVPAPGQGVLALEGRAHDSRVKEAVGEITDADAFACLRAERALAGELEASCHTPLGAHATPAGRGCLHLRAWVGLPDGSAWIADELAGTGTDLGDTRFARIPESASAEGACPPASVGGSYDPEALGRRVAERMKAAGAEELLRRAEEMALEHA